MWYSDLKPYQYGLPIALTDVVTVGWLSPSESFATGDLDAKIVRALEELVVSHRVNKTRGYHFCELCAASQPIALKQAAGTVLLGSAEIWIPSRDATMIYAAPDLIVHYVATHRYLLPTEFLDAAMHVHSHTNWNPDRECEKRLEAAYST